MYKSPWYPFYNYSSIAGHKFSPIKYLQPSAGVSTMKTALRSICLAGSLQIISDFHLIREPRYKIPQSYHTLESGYVASLSRGCPFVEQFGDQLSSTSPTSLARFLATFTELYLYKLRPKLTKINFCLRITI